MSCGTRLKRDGGPSCGRFFVTRVPFALSCARLAELDPVEPGFTGFFASGDDAEIV